MFTKLSQVGQEIKPADLYAGFRSVFISKTPDFREFLSGYLPAKHIYLLNSGTAAFFMILQALKAVSPKTEVILPAYTAPAMVLPVLNCGLKPVICDISLADFNMDLDLLPGLVNENTLCIVATHLFGIPNQGINKLKARFPDTFIIEDCAQSFGSMVENRNTGSFCDIGFLSFNRGKNLSTYGGGCIFTNNQELADKVETHINELKNQSINSLVALPFKMAAFSLATNPCIYGMFYPLISRFKDMSVPKDFIVRQYSSFQSGAGLSLSGRINEASQRRYQNGTSLINGLSGAQGIKLPLISKEAKSAFNRLPLLLDNPQLHRNLEKVLLKAGIDISRMYLKPVHQFFDLGFKQSAFPNATYLAGRLLTLPTHPLVRQEDLSKIILSIKEAV